MAGSALSGGLIVLAFVGAATAESPVKPRARTFEFTYSATLTGLKPGQKAAIWLPVPPALEEQDVKVVRSELPEGAKTAVEPTSGNRMTYATAMANREGKIALLVVYKVTRREVKGETGKKFKLDAASLKRLLQPDHLVPIAGKPLKLLKGKTVPEDEMKLAKVLYETVNSHMKYSKEGTGWGRGDAVWACDSKYGNCSDFHSLFISLARGKKIPARFEIGFPLPEKRGKGDIAGYHCWAFFKPKGKAWVPVDISEANKTPKLASYYFGNLTEDRVTFSGGRDLTLVPKQKGKALNFFIYPYVEVAGKEYPQEKIVKKFSFADVKEKQ